MDGCLGDCFRVPGWSGWLLLPVEPHTVPDDRPQEKPQAETNYEVIDANRGHFHRRYLIYEITIIKCERFNCIF